MSLEICAYEVGHYYPNGASAVIRGNGKSLRRTESSAEASAWRGFVLYCFSSQIRHLDIRNGPRLIMLLLNCV